MKLASKQSPPRDFWSKRCGVAENSATVGYQTEKDEPHPQVVEALGLRITNCAPCRPSV